MAEGSLEPVEAFARVSRNPARGQSQHPGGGTRPPPECPRPAPARCPLPQLGPRFPRAPRPAFARGTLPWVAGARSAAQSRAARAPGRRPTRPHSLALAAALALAPDRWRSWPVQTRSSQLPGRPAPSRRGWRGVRRAAHRAPAARSPAAPAPCQPRGARRHSDPGDPPGEARGARGRRGAGRGGTGVPLVRRVEGAGSRGSEWPRRWAVPESPPFGGPQVGGGRRGRLRARGGGALLWGHDRARKPGARDPGNCCGIALAFL